MGENCQQLEVMQGIENIPGRGKSMNRQEGKGSYKLAQDSRQPTAGNEAEELGRGQILGACILRDLDFARERWDPEQCPPPAPLPPPFRDTAIHLGERARSKANVCDVNKNTKSIAVMAFGKSLSSLDKNTLFFPFRLL